MELTTKAERLPAQAMVLTNTLTISMVNSDGTRPHDDEHVPDRLREQIAAAAELEQENQQR